METYKAPSTREKACTVGIKTLHAGLGHTFSSQIFELPYSNAVNDLKIHFSIDMDKNKPCALETFTPVETPEFASWISSSILEVDYSDVYEPIDPPSKQVLDTL